MLLGKRNTFFCCKKKGDLIQVIVSKNLQWEFIPKNLRRRGGDNTVVQAHEAVLFGGTKRTCKDVSLTAECFLWGGNAKSFLSLLWEFTPKKI